MYIIYISTIHICFTYMLYIYDIHTYIATSWFRAARSTMEIHRVGNLEIFQ